MGRFWTPEMNKRLREGVEKYGEKNWRAGLYDVGNLLAVVNFTLSHTHTRTHARARLSLIHI